MSASFYNTICNLYGEVYLNKVRRFASLRIKRNKLECGLVFIQKCREYDIVPKCLHIKPIKCVRDYSKFFSDVNNKLLKWVIRDYYRKIACVTRELMQLHLELSRGIRSDLWDTLDAMTYSRAQVNLINTTQKHESKIKRLIKNSYNCASSPNTSTLAGGSVVNLSTQEITEHAKSALSKGLNFALAPHKIPVETIVTGIEETISRNNIPIHDAECLRQEVASMVRKSKIPKRNISTNEMNALRSLRRNEELLVLPADKGNATVIVDTAEYERKMNELLNDGNTYKRVTYNPTSRVTAKLKTLLCAISDDLYAKLRPMNPTPPRIYGLPKIHKPLWPLRPIVSQIDSPTYKTARHLADLLLPLTRNTTSYVRDSFHFTQLIEEVVISEDELMVSFDITSLFTNIPIEDTVKIITDLFQRTLIPIEYINILEYILKSGYFMWRGEFFLQMEGVAMGSPIAPVIANIFMEWFEKSALQDTPWRPRHWWRYVDDVFAILHRDNVMPLLEHLNSRHPSIAFTIEQETEGSLPFLDVLIKRDKSGRLSHTVYRKKTHTDRYLRADSHHHPAQLASLPRTLINRALRLCDPQYIDTELAHVKSVLEANGYTWKQGTRIANTSTNNRVTSVERAVTYLPYVKGVTDKIGHLLRRRYSIKTIFRPPTQVRRLLRSPKDMVPLGAPGVYMIPCDCGECYIGETRRNVCTRMKEHISAMKNADSNISAVAEHALKPSLTHYIRFDKARILAHEKYFVPRKIREAIEISRRPNFNRDRGWALPPAWKTILHGTYDKLRGTEDTTSFACQSLTPWSNESDSDEDQDEETRLTSPPPPATTFRTITPPPPPPQLPSARALRAVNRSARRDAATSVTPHSRP